MFLSPRFFWNQSADYKEGLEAAISCAIEKGTSAITLSKRLSKYLGDYDKLRKDYKQMYGTATDINDCEYRSARLARTEINMAYRRAEQERWNQFDFVVGKRIKTSSIHKDRMPDGDICDTLAGDYPKDFVWSGWHPNCTCYEIPIMKTEEEFWNEDEDYKSDNEVDDVPDNFKEWVKDNQERIAAADVNGTQPYFVKDNKNVVNDVIANYIPPVKYEGSMELPIIDKKHFMELYEQEGLLSLSNIQEENINDIARINNTQVSPMTFFEADNGKANLSLDTENCQTCVVAIEARRRGLNVTSLSYTGMDNKFMYELGENFEKAFINPRTGRTATPSIVRGDNAFNKLLMRTNQNGRYAIGINATEDGIQLGHVIYAERFSNNDLSFASSTC
jgi:hypothetical protein